MGNKKTALLVMDLQFGPLWETYKKEETLNIIKRLIVEAQTCDIPIFYTQHEELPGGILIKGSPFWKFEPGFSPRQDDIVIHKQATDAFYRTPLTEELQALGINHLVIVGARTEYCVDTTCRAALSLGFNVTLVEDGHTTVDGILPAQDIIKHHNYNLSTVCTLDRKITVIPANNINFCKVGM